MMGLPADSGAMQALLAAYLNTRYQARVYSQPVTLSVGQACPALEVLGPDTPWALITPYNPASKKLSDEHNQGRLLSLQQNLAGQPAEVFAATNTDPQGRWPDEKGVLVAPMELATAAGLAGLFGQYALLAGRGTGPAMLVLLGPDWADVDCPEHVIRMEAPARES